MRLFIAIDLDEAARAAIAEEQKRLGAVLRANSRSALKWVRPDRMHLTLVFLGEVDEARATPLIDEIGREIVQPPFDVVFGELGVFPARGAPNVLWAGVTSGAQPAAALQRTVSERVGRHGFPPETRPFRPHLTLARWRESRAADRQHVMEAGQRDVTALCVDHVTLYQSRLSPAGPSYTALARANLCSPQATTAGAEAQS
jgi:RNA 2',3'-cyclic 3'-phosphodiesterase